MPRYTPALPRRQGGGYSSFASSAAGDGAVALDQLMKMLSQGQQIQSAERMQGLQLDHEKDLANKYAAVQKCLQDDRFMDNHRQALAKAVAAVSAPAGAVDPDSAMGYRIANITALTNADLAGAKLYTTMYASKLNRDEQLDHFLRILHAQQVKGGPNDQMARAGEYSTRISAQITEALDDLVDRGVPVGRMRGYLTRSLFGDGDESVSVPGLQYLLSSPDAILELKGPRGKPIFSSWSPKMKRLLTLTWGAGLRKGVGFTAEENREIADMKLSPEDHAMVAGVVHGSLEHDDLGIVNDDTIGGVLGAVRDLEKKFNANPTKYKDQMPYLDKLKTAARNTSLGVAAAPWGNTSQVNEHMQKLLGNLAMNVKDGDAFNKRYAEGVIQTILTAPGNVQIFQQHLHDIDPNAPAAQDINTEMIYEWGLNARNTPELDVYAGRILFIGQDTTSKMSKLITESAYQQRTTLERMDSYLGQVRNLGELHSSIMLAEQAGYSPGTEKFLEHAYRKANTLLKNLQDRTGSSDQFPGIDGEIDTQDELSRFLAGYDHAGSYYEWFDESRKRTQDAAKKITDARLKDLDKVRYDLMNRAAEAMTPQQPVMPPAKVTKTYTEPAPSSDPGHLPYAAFYNTNYDLGHPGPEMPPTQGGMPSPGMPRGGAVTGVAPEQAATQPPQGPTEGVPGVESPPGASHMWNPPTASPGGIL